MTNTNTNNDWRQVIVNLETQLGAGYSYGLCHDLVIAQRELAREREASDE